MRQNIADDDDDVDDYDGKGSEGRIKQAQDERCLASCREIKTMWAASLKTIYPDDADDGDDGDGNGDDGGGDDGGADDGDDEDGDDD